MILALDVSITSTGYVLFNKDGDVKGFGTIRTDNKKDIYARLLFIEDEVVKLINDFKVKEIAIEAPAYGGRGSMSYQLFGVHFSIVRLMYSENLPYKLLNIASIKKFATSSGRASKTQMLQALPEEVREWFTSAGFMKSKGLYDLTDAYFIGKKYINDKKLK
jgi:Holliday junction resolvasome RuvABC endonuclease subunit